MDVGLEEKMKSIFSKKRGSLFAVFILLMFLFAACKQPLPSTTQQEESVVQETDEAAVVALSAVKAPILSKAVNNEEKKEIKVSLQSAVQTSNKVEAQIDVIFNAAKQSNNPALLDAAYRLKKVYSLTSLTINLNSMIQGVGTGEDTPDPSDDKPTDEGLDEDLESVVAEYYETQDLLREVIDLAGDDPLVRQAAEQTLPLVDDLGDQLNVVGDAVHDAITVDVETGTNADADNDGDGIVTATDADADNDGSVTIREYADLGLVVDSDGDFIDDNTGDHLILVGDTEVIPIGVIDLLDLDYDLDQPLPPEILDDPLPPEVTDDINRDGIPEDVVLDVVAPEALDRIREVIEAQQSSTEPGASEAGAAEGRGRIDLQLGAPPEVIDIVSDVITTTIGDQGNRYVDHVDENVDEHFDNLVNKYDGDRDNDGTKNVDETDPDDDLDGDGVTNENEVKEGTELADGTEIVDVNGDGVDDALQLYNYDLFLDTGIPPGAGLPDSLPSEVVQAIEEADEKRADGEFVDVGDIIDSTLKLYEPKLTDIITGDNNFAGDRQTYWQNYDPEMAKEFAEKWREYMVSNSEYSFVGKEFVGALTLPENFGWFDHPETYVVPEVVAAAEAFEKWGYDPSDQEKSFEKAKDYLPKYQWESFENNYETMKEFHENMERFHNEYNTEVAKYSPEELKETYMEVHYGDEYTSGNLERLKEMDPETYKEKLESYEGYVKNYENTFEHSGGEFRMSSDAYNTYKDYGAYGAPQSADFQFVPPADVAAHFGYTPSSGGTGYEYNPSAFGGSFTPPAGFEGGAFTGGEHGGYQPPAGYTPSSEAGSFYSGPVPAGAVGAEGGTFGGPGGGDSGGFVSGGETGGMTGGHTDGSGTPTGHVVYKGKKIERGWY